MFDFLRNLTKSAEEKHQEELHAYLDDALSPRARQQFEQELAQNAALQAKVDDLRVIKQQLRDLPRQPVPRNFTLDPAVYGRPVRQPLFQFYPVLQGATALTALFFIMALSLSLLQPRTETGAIASAPQPSAAGEVAAFATESSAPSEAATDTFAFESSNEAPAAAEEMEAQAAPAEEEAAADEAMIEEAVEEPLAEEETMEEAESDGGALGEASVEATAVFPPVITTDVAALPAPQTSSLATATPQPTPTVSILPRSTSTPATARSVVISGTIAAYDEEIARTDTNTSDAVKQEVAPTATPSLTQLELIPIPTLRIIQIVLGVLLIILFALTLHVQRNS